MFIDVHTHLTDPAFDRDREEVIKRSGCAVLINNGYTPKNNRETLALAKKYSQVKVAMGLHPSETWKMEMQDVEKEIAFIRTQKELIAIGEIGLDGTYDHLEKQKEIFRKMLTLAQEMDLPVICHSRKAEKEIIDILEEIGMKRVVLHCFTGKLKLAERAVALGYSLSIPAILGHSSQFQELVKRTPLTHLFTETDAPYLCPRGDERNEPRNVQLTVAKIAEIKDLDAEEVMKAIYMNYQKLFL